MLSFECVCLFQSIVIRPCECNLHFFSGQQEQDKDRAGFFSLYGLRLRLKSLQLS